MMELDSDSRFIVLESPHLLSRGDTDAYLMAALEEIVVNNPPRSRYPHEVLHGLWSGPTGTAYLLLQVSKHQPDLVISGQRPQEWAQAYIAGSRGHNLRLGSHGCGISDEKLAWEAVRAAISQDLRHVREFISSVSQIVGVDEFPDENLYGRSGTLYLLRLVRHWVPESRRLVEPLLTEIANTIITRGPNWKWHGHRYLGAVHGDIGIITQVVLTDPELAPCVELPLDRLLDMQLADGNWPSSEDSSRTSKGLVQFCHGAPGVVISLLSLRPYYPELQTKIDEAIRKGRECIWNQGLLKKEPNLCHGIFGNALALAVGPHREHFLGVASPENVSQMKASDSTGTVFMRADYGRSYSTLTSYTPGAVWTWLVCREESPGILGYNDF